MNRPQFTAPMDSSNFIAPENVMIRNEIAIREIREMMDQLKREHPDIFKGGKKRSNRRTRRIHNKSTRKVSRIHTKKH
jgi:hypothetical protein